MEVPKRSWRVTTEEHKNQKNFEFEVGKVLSEQFPGWSDFLKFDWSQSYFTLKGKRYAEDNWGGSAVTKFKRGLEFKLDKKKALAIADHIEKTKLARQYEDDQKSLEVFLAKTLTPIIKKFSSETVCLELEHNRFLVIGVGRKGHYGIDVDATVRIDRKGKISEPTKRFSKSVGSLRTAQEFITEFQPIHDRLIELAFQIKEELPKEWFENQ